MSLSSDQRTRLQLRTTEELLAKGATIVESAGRKEQAWRGAEVASPEAAGHVQHLVAAVAADSPELFADHVAWAKCRYKGNGASREELARQLGWLREAVSEALPGDLAESAVRIVDHGLGKLPECPEDVPPALTGGQPHAALAERYLHSLLLGQRHEAAKLIHEAVDKGAGVSDLYLHVFQPVQYEIGRLWQMDHISVAQEHYCTAATQLIMSQLYPYIFSSEKNGKTFVGACVEGDLHEIGMRMVCDFFEMEGWDTTYLGANMPTEQLVKLLSERSPDVLGVSVTMPYHLAPVTQLIEKVRATPACDGIVILVGGYTFKAVPGLARAVGADGTSDSAAGAIALAVEMVDARKTR